MLRLDDDPYAIRQDRLHHRAGDLFGEPLLDLQPPCEAYALMGRDKEARALFERLLALRNDVGLLSEQYDPEARRFLGNFPQAFSHVGLINTACNLTPRQPGPALHRKGD